MRTSMRKSRNASDRQIIAAENNTATTTPAAIGVNSLANRIVTTSVVSSAETVDRAIAPLMYLVRRKIARRSLSIRLSRSASVVRSRWSSSVRARSTMRDSRWVSMLSVMPTPESRKTGPRASWISFAMFSV
jgi:hypothetical protein